MIKAVLFDRDATLNKTTQILRPGQSPGDQTDGYVLAPEEMELFDAVKPALTLLRKNNIVPFVFTQQNCISKGLITKEGVESVHKQMNTLLGPDAQIEDFYFAWKQENEPDPPRVKPHPTMILEILRDYHLQKEEVVAVGDSMRDYQSAKSADVNFVWIKDDLKRVNLENMQATGCPVFNDVLQFVEEYILAEKTISATATT